MLFRFMTLFLTWLFLFFSFLINLLCGLFCINFAIIFFLVRLDDIVFNFRVLEQIVHFFINLLLVEFNLIYFSLILQLLLLLLLLFFFIFIFLFLFPFYSYLMVCLFQLLVLVFFITTEFFHVHLSSVSSSTFSLDRTTQQTILTYHTHSFSFFRYTIII